MKHLHSPLVTLIIGAIISAGISSAAAQTRAGQQPVVITPPAVKDGSNWSRAPFPAARQFDDVKGPDGKAVDDLPPNTPGTNPEPPLPPPVVAILQPTAPGITTPAEPALMPTGRPTVAVAPAVDASTFASSLRAATVSSRDQVLADLEARMASSENTMATMRSTAAQMSADARRAFHAASDEVTEKLRALRRSIQSARNATAQNWESVRTQLAADFDAYAAALARMDAAAGTGPTFR